MYFKNIVGQNFAKRYFLNSISKNRINHAYIFEGIDGIGKKLFAKELSKILLNTNNLEYSPDYIDISSNENSSIKIEKIRDLQKDIIVKPHSNYKIYLIDEADKLTEQAQNALLKTLEEPPSYIVFILITSNKEKILDTIKSRCELIKFSAISPRDMKTYFENMNFNEEKIDIAISFSKGSIKKALEFLNEQTNKNEISFYDLREKTKEYIDILFEKDLFNISSIIDDILSYKNSIYDFLDIFLSYFVDSMTLKENIDKNIIVNVDKLTFIRNISKKISYSQMTKIIDIIEITKKKLKCNCNFNITISVMFFNIYEVIK